MKDKCEKLKGLSLETLSVKLKVEQQLQELDESENNCKRLQTRKSKSKSVFEMIKEVLIQASTSMGQTSQEQSLLDENSDLPQNGDTQSSEIEPSSRSTRMKSTLQIEKQKLLDNLEELSQAIGEFRLEFERTSEPIIPITYLFSLLTRGSTEVEKDNQRFSVTCQRLKTFILETIRLKMMVEEKLRQTDEHENKMQTWRSEMKWVGEKTQ